MRVVLYIALPYLFGCSNNHVVNACEPNFSMKCNLSSASADNFYNLPFVCNDEINEIAYEPISIQAFSSDGTLTITIKNTGGKGVILRSTGVHIRLRRTPFYVIQGKKEVALSLPSKLEIAAGEELHLSCPINNSMSNFVHVGFVSLIVVGERVYDGLPERKVPIQHKQNLK